jgi:enoyl-CoA hydratase/carnithine racemase
VNLGLIPGYGATQRLPRIIGFPEALEMLRTARTLNAKKACELGWALETPVSDPLSVAREVIDRHLEGKETIGPVDPAPLSVPDALAERDIGHRSLVIDAILVDTVRRGAALPLAEGLDVEAKGLADCKRTIDFDIGMSNFIQNGPRVPAEFLHE